MFVFSVEFSWKSIQIPHNLFCQFFRKLINMYSILLLSGGKGCRMQDSTPKQYLLLAGKPMIMHSIERFDRINEISEIVIVCESSYRDVISQMAREYNITKKIVFADAGESRQGSVFNGLRMVRSEFVIIHEAARPFVRTDEFLRLINEKEQNVTYGYDIPFTVLKGKSYVNGILNRAELINVQLPQKFHVKTLLDAHKKAMEAGDVYTEDASLLFNIEKSDIKVMRGTSYNIKITDPIDLLLGEIIYKNYITNRK